MSDEIDRDLYQRLCNRDPRAPSEFCEQYLPLLLADRRWRLSGVRDDHMIEEAAISAVLPVVERPESYKPARQRIMAYLRIAANGDLRNLVARERKHASRRAPLDAVEFQRSVGKDSHEPMPLPSGVSQELMLRRLRERFPDPRDLAAIRLILDGIKKNEEFARVYNIRDLPLSEQRTLVKRNKDRLKNAMKRMGMQIRGDGRD